MNLGVETAILKLMEDANEIYHQTGVPPCPSCLFFPCGMIVCLPLSFHCSDRRKSCIKRLAKDFNKEHKHEGISITFVEFVDYDYQIPIGLYVHLNVSRRRKYCAQKGIAFQMPQTIPYPQPIIVPKIRSRDRSFFGSGGGGGDGCGGDGGGGCGGGD